MRFVVETMLGALVIATAIIGAVRMARTARPNFRHADASADMQLIEKGL